jgi:hypothetical protein
MFKKIIKRHGVMGREKSRLTLSGKGDAILIIAGKSVNLNGSGK